MADNSTQASDDIGGIIYPRVKISWGADGSANDTSATNPLPTTLGTKIAGEDIPNDLTKVEQRFSSTVISTATTTAVRTGSGFLHCITVTGGTAGTIIGYDNTAASGTKLFDFDSTSALETYTFNVTFATGLTIVTSAATKLSVSSR